MSKSDTFAAVLKFINGRNDSKEYLQEVCDYITDPAKTDNGKLVSTYGCSKEHPLEDILVNKELWHKTHGKQGEHFVLALASCSENKSPLEVLSVVKEIVATVYPENMAIIAGHTDSKYLHFHVVLDAVNAVTGRKFSQSPTDLNRVKQKANNILKKHGFEIITASANDFVDQTDYSNKVGFDFLELDESKFITESDIEEISEFTDSVSLTNTSDLFSGWDYPSFKDYFYGGYNMNNNHKSHQKEAQYMPVTAPTPTVEAVSSTLPAVMQAQDMPISTSANDTVPTLVGATENRYPNTNVVVGPIFRIKGNQNSNFAGLDFLVEKTTAYAYEHLPKNSNLALAMQEYGQRTGHPSNVSVIGSPIFELDVSVSENSEYDDDVDYIDGDCGMFK